MIILIALFLFSLLVLYFYSTKNFNYWKKRGVCYIKPSPFIGNLGPMLSMKYSIGEFLQKIYNDYKEEPYVGIFLTNTPCLVIRDLELANKILKQDFNHFHHRIFTMSRKTDPIGARSLFSMHGKEWKNTRSKIAPIFVPSKQKIVYDDMIRVGEKLAKKFGEANSIEIKELSCCYTANIISNALLGIDGKAIEDPDNDSMRMLGNESFSQSIRNSMSFLTPELMNTLNIAVHQESTYKIISDALKSAIERKKNGSNHRGDYIDALLDLKNKEPWEGNNGEIIVPDDENLISQMFMFFAGTFETGSNGVAHCFYEAAKNQEIQDKIRDEIKHFSQGAKIEYEALNNMTYISNFINDCLRKNPPFPFMNRKCSQDYRVPNADLVIEKGVKILIPTLGFHRDEKYYPEPDSVIPERYYDAEAMRDKPNFAFGTGPRICLGMRFAQQFMKIALISCLSEYKLTVSNKTPENWKMNPKRFGYSPDCDIVLDVHKLE